MKNQIPFLIISFSILITCTSRNFIVYSQKISNKPADWNNTTYMKSDDPNFPDRKYAMLTTMTGVTFSSLDDEKLEVNPGSYLVILPGKHSVSVGFQQGNLRSNYPKKLDFEVKQNQTVFICANQYANNWNPDVRIMDELFPLLKNVSPPCR